MTLPDREIDTYHELAAVLRDMIRAGELRPGALLPGERSLSQQYGVGSGLVRRALTALRNEGLIEPSRGGPHQVRVPAEVQTLRLQRGSRIVWRMPSPSEKRELRIGDGVPVLVVTYAGETKLYPGDRWQASCQIKGSQALTAHPMIGDLDEGLSNERP